MSQVQQKYLGANGLVVLLGLLSAFVPLSTDLYLPALPKMSAYFDVGADRINLTLTAFFVFYALGTLIWGPLSDRYGCKPILLAGSGLYVVASIFCALMWNVNGLIVCRIFQVIGGSASGVVATAIVKDVYSGKKHESILAIVQSMVTISPAVAPVLGAFLLRVLSWRGVFWALAGIGAAALIGSLLYGESIPQRTSRMLLHNLGHLGRVLQNRGFTMLLPLFSLGCLSVMAFIASSTYIYQDGFHLSGQVYSYYFSLNALGMLAGPMIYLRLSRRFHSENIIRTCYGIILTSGLLVCLLGNLQPWIFALCMLPATIVGSCIRPPSANILLEQQKGDTGAVSSLMGIMTMGTASVSLLAWPFVLKRVIRLPGPNALSLPKSDLIDA